MADNGEDLLLSDDLLPNEVGSAMYEPDEEDEKDEIEQEADNERHMIRSASPALLEELFDWFDNEIAATDSNKAVTNAASKYNVSREEASVAFEIVHDLLRDKKEQLKTLKEIHRP